MNYYKYLSDASFLREVDELQLKYYYARIIVLTFDEKPIKEIQGRILKGSSININGTSAVRRTCNMNFAASEYDNDLTDVDSLLGINKKIIIEVGYKNTTDKYKEYDILWFPQGVFVINQISFTHNLNSIQISISCKDKMCLLNGEAGGTFPTSVTFNPRYQYDEKNNVTEVEATFYEIIQTAVCNFGGEDLGKIIISDIPLRIKQLTHYSGASTLYHRTSGDNKYTTDYSEVAKKPDDWDDFNYNEDIGYRYVDFVYPKELTCGMNDNVAGLLDTIVKTLGNFEYFYDVYGNFIFREKKNYLNNSFMADNASRLNGVSKTDTDLNNLVAIDNSNYQVDFSQSSSIYTFNRGNGLITSYTNTPNYENIKNDYHIWGKSKDSLPIHYHLAIKKKPEPMDHYVLMNRDNNGNLTGTIKAVVDENFKNLEVKYENNELTLENLEHQKQKYDNGILLIEEKSYDKEYENNTLTIEGDIAYKTGEHDWRVELFLMGKEKERLSQRPDMYEQELIDNLPSIYKFKYDKETDTVIGEYKENIFRPNNLSYFVDFIEPYDRDISIYSIDALNPRMYTYQQDNIKRIYDRDVPNVILLKVAKQGDEEDKARYQKEQQEAVDNGDVVANVDASLFNNTAPTTVGYSAVEIAREALYQHLFFNNSISIQTIPIYYLDVNKRITIEDDISGIHGDYVISSITLPLDAESNMSISAIKALTRV